MYLGGQAGQRGYAMAAVLVAIALMSVVMTALLPAWRQQVRREKEAELVFRGEQYARAVLLYRRKMNGSSPMTIDALVQGRFLRKKFKDPMTGEDFQPLYLGQQPGQQGQQPAGRSGQPQQQGGVGITGVVSKSKEASIRIYRGGSTYNTWNFWDPIGNRRGGPGGGNPGQNPGQGGPGGRGPGGTGPGGSRGGVPAPGGGPAGGSRGPGMGPGPGRGPGGGRGPR